MFILIFFPIFAILITLVMIPISFYRLKKKSNLLITHFNARLSLLGDLQFCLTNKNFHLARIGVTNSTSGGGGSYPLVWREIRSIPNLVVGNVGLKKYLYIGAFPLHNCIIDIGGLEIVVVSSSLDLMKAVETLFNTDEKSRTCALDLFQKQYSHFEIKREFHVGGRRLLQKKVVVKYTGISESIYEKPQILESTLNSMEHLLNKINMTFRNK